MKDMLKKLGIIGGGTAAACAACCAAPALLAPLLGLVGLSSLAYSSWLAAVIAIPVAMLSIRLLRRRAGQGEPGSKRCGCSRRCAPERAASRCE